MSKEDRKEDRRRRREEERGEELKGAVADIEWLREHGVTCEWRAARDFSGRHYREHVLVAVDDTWTNSGANASVDERHLRMDRGDRMVRLAELDKLEAGRDVLKEAFDIANMKGAADEL